MIACPVCGDTQVRKAVMGPAVSAKSNQRDTGASIPTSERQVPASAPVVEGRGIALSNSSAAEMVRMRALISALAETQAKILENSEWVGRDFADRARALHYGEGSQKQHPGHMAAAGEHTRVAEGVKGGPLNTH